MATKRRTTTPRRPATRRRKGWSFPTLSISPEVARSLFGLTLLVLGVITMIMIFLPASQGSLTEWAQRTVNPLFGSGRWLLPFLLVAAGAYIEWRGAPGAGWQWRLVAATASYVAFLALLEFLPVRGGGRIGTALAQALSQVVGNTVIVFVLLIAVIVGGIVVALQRPLRHFVDPIIDNLRVVASRPPEAAKPGAKGKAAAAAGPASPVAPSRFEPREAVGPGPSILDEPAPRGGPGPMSQTVWTGSGDGTIGGSRAPRVNG